MTVSAHVYGQFLNALATKTINLSSDTLKVMLVTSAYTPNQGSDQYASTPQAHEATGTGYTSGGVALSSVSLSDSGDTFSLSAANTSWANISTTARYAVVYDSAPGSFATDPLICYIDFGADQSPSGVTFEIDWSAGVVVQITAS
ncbi:hypothetical protein [Mycobacterium malmoense]|uniref:hypothetical protein n=1 Tax=Mycobacterium malmoense TaxID=1780 RepID=UPI0008F828F6|nr:hypothetical protein [Mycobacterium malmoense]OIN80861.1 hypothetical protein BMG05_11035 [Mycobacterium malmoense]